MIAINESAMPSPEDDGDGKEHRDRKSRTRGRGKRGRGKKCANLTIDDVPRLRKAMAKGFRLSCRIRERMVEFVAKLNESDDPELRLKGVELGLEMERVSTAVDRNQIAEGKTTEHKHLHLHQRAQIEIVHVDDWYGSKAAHLAAPDGPSTPDSFSG